MIKNTVNLVILVLNVCLLIQIDPSTPLANCNNTNETEAEEWFKQYDIKLAAIYSESSKTAWQFSTNMTKENEENYVKVQIKSNTFLLSQTLEIKQFNWTAFKNESLKKLFINAGGSPSCVKTDANITSVLINAEKQSRLSAKMSKIYNSATVPSPDNPNTKLSLEPDITRMMTNTEISEPIKKALWKGWRDAVGKPMKKVYEEFVTLSNSMIKESGYLNVAAYWQSWYETQNFEPMMDRLWNELKPFYQELHAYVRTKLRAKYGDKIFPPTGQIPAHILGNMWAQSWHSIEKFATPYPNVKKIDFTEQLKNQNWDAMKMFRVSEDFFSSIGLKNMTDTFWKKSVIKKIPNVTMECHASAWDFYTNKGDFRILQCTDITAEYFAIIHHEMGHIQYYQEYEKQPVVFRGGANPGFHEAVGDVITLSVLTPDHLKKIGLLNSTVDSKEYYINYLFNMALVKIGFIPFGFLMDKWRWRVYDGSTPVAKYNEDWWKLRCGIQGVSSPVLRSADDFDAGSKYHIPSNVPYIRYFISHILQFQFQKALCVEAGHTGPLYRCDIYQNKAAGAKLSAALSLGSSKPWPEVLQNLTGSRDMTVAPLLEYFKDLHDYLKEENKKSGVKVGWDDNCPPNSWYNNGATRTTNGIAIKCLLLVTAFFLQHLFIIFVLVEVSFYKNK